MGFKNRQGKQKYEPLKGKALEKYFKELSKADYSVASNERLGSAMSNWGVWAKKKWAKTNKNKQNKKSGTKKI